jgi:hypothetical protein
MLACFTVTASISKGRHEEARQTVAKWHAGGDLSGVSAPIVAQELREIEDVINMESSAASASYLDLVKGLGNRKR